MLTSDTTEIKAALDIDPDNPAEDKKLNFFLEYATGWIEDYLARPGLTLRRRTEYYSGSGTQKIILKHRPVYPRQGTAQEIECYVDDGGFWGSASGAFNSDYSSEGGTRLVYGTDFALWIDQEDGTSRSAILLRINQLWERRSARQRGLLSPFITDGFGNIKVVYDGGYTIDNMPAAFRLATLLIVARLRVLLPYGFFPQAESYEERSISVQLRALWDEVREMLAPYRNWYW